jgi:MoxR-like ATPase
MMDVADKVKAINDALIELRKLHGDSASAGAIWSYSKKVGTFKHGWIANAERKTSRGLYDLTRDQTEEGITVRASGSPRSTGANTAVRDALRLPDAPALTAVAAEPNSTVVPFPGNPVSLRQVIDNLVPEKMGTYVPFGAFRDILMIVESKIFYPAFITGLTGNGKTVMVEQVCAKLGRECIRVNLTEETDEDDLVGGNTLVDGNVVYREGPVLTAMRRGAVLILDECDLNATKILCLQGIMEGKPYFVKKTGETVYPAHGFNIFATANTKGRGSDSGRYVGTKIMNEAFLERFPITFEQEYPAQAVEKKIIMNNFRALGIDGQEDFAENLAKWAEVIRKSFEDGATEDLISTRRLVAIAKAFAIFGDRKKAIALCLNRFDRESKESFADVYAKIDATVDAMAAPEVLNEEVF